MSKDIEPQEIEITTADAIAAQLTPYEVIQKYLEVLEAVQKSVGVQPVIQHHQVIESEPKNELIDLEPNWELSSDITDSQPSCEKDSTCIVAQLAEQRFRLADLKAQNMKLTAENSNMMARNHQKFIEAQSRFAECQILFKSISVRKKS
ncbi:hypothetical protein NUACC21_76290 [Scytonema sp. NUACC21]